MPIFALMLDKKPRLLHFFFVSIFQLIFLQNAESQVLNPAKWTYEASKKQVSIGETIELIFKASIDDNWYIYSNDFDPNLGPLLTEFKFKPNPGFQLVGKTKAIHPKEKFDEIWGGKIKYFMKEGEFRQKVKILNANAKITGTYEGQVCTTTDGKCIQFDGEFDFSDLKILPSKSESANEVAQNPSNQSTSNLKETQAEKTSVNDSAASISAQNPGIDSAASISESAQKATTASISKPEPVKQQDSLWTFVLLAFLSGLVALLTPCVFPMIPMTVTFFTRSSGSRAGGIKMALVYGFSIIFLYTTAGTLFAALFGAEAANFLSTHWAPNLFFFITFVLFGMSFLGMFEIVLPSSWVNSADRQSEKGGVYGVFFMAFTLVLVSFSCTGPIVGTLLVQSANGEFLRPVVGMFSFSMAFALPFTLFAIFPHWLSGLPKSGGWLNSVKVVLGFVELALALKFLSIADQTYHWGILDREVYLSFWIVIFSLIGFYFLGKISLPHDSEIERISVPRMLMAIVTFSFVVYMIPGLWGAPLKALSGYLPPETTLDFNINNSQTRTSNQTNSLCEKPRFGDILKLPHGLQGYFDYKQALACAKQQNKPIFIDFTGHGCVNCREMEANVWAEPEVLKQLQEDFILLALYVDDKTELPENEWYVSKYDGKEKRTIGKQNADLQITRYGNNAQPYYVLLGPDEKLLAQPRGYDKNVAEFASFLSQAKKAVL